MSDSYASHLSDDQLKPAPQVDSIYDYGVGNLWVVTHRTGRSGAMRKIEVLAGVLGEHRNIE